jgi:hypothetical protein
MVPGLVFATLIFENRSIRVTAWIDIPGGSVTDGVNNQLRFREP